MMRRVALRTIAWAPPTQGYFLNIKIRKIPLRLGQVAGGSQVGSVHSLGPEKNSTISEFIIRLITLVGHTHKQTHENGSPDCGLYRQSRCYRYSRANGRRGSFIGLSLLKVIFL